MSYDPNDPEFKALVESIRTNPTPLVSLIELPNGRFKVQHARERTLQRNDAWGSRYKSAFTYRFG